MSDIYTALQSKERTYDGWIYHRKSGVGIIAAGVVANSVTVQDTRAGGSGVALTVPSGAAILNLAFQLPRAVSLGAGAPALKLGTAANVDDTSATVAAASLVSAGNGAAIAAGVANSKIVHGAPVIAGSVLTFNLYGFSAAGSTGSAANITVADGEKMAIPVEIFYAVRNTELSLDDVFFWGNPDVSKDFVDTYGPN